MKKYLVNYVRDGEEKTYKVSANNKQEAYNKFNFASSGKYKVTTIKKDVSKAFHAIVCAVIFVAIVVFTVCVISTTWGEPEPVEYMEYVVEPGDTLWGIARQSDMWNKIDASIIIDDMCEISNCTAAIYPGQIVYIPMYGE